jgi:hypothetical protein
VTALLTVALFLWPDALLRLAQDVVGYHPGGHA